MMKCFLSRMSTKHVNLIIKRTFLNLQCRRILCDALVLLHLNFTDSVYGNCCFKIRFSSLTAHPKFMCVTHRRTQKARTFFQIHEGNCVCSLFKKDIYCTHALYNEIKFHTYAHNINVARFPANTHGKALHHELWTIWYQQIYAPPYRVLAVRNFKISILIDGQRLNGHEGQQILTS